MDKNNELKDIKNAVSSATNMIKGAMKEPWRSSYFRIMLKSKQQITQASSKVVEDPNFKRLTANSAKAQQISNKINHDLERALNEVEQKVGTANHLNLKLGEQRSTQHLNMSNAPKVQALQSESHFMRGEYNQLKTRTTDIVIGNYRKEKDLVKAMEDANQRQEIKQELQEFNNTINGLDKSAQQFSINLRPLDKRATELEHHIKTNVETSGLSITIPTHPSPETPRNPTEQQP